MAKASGFPSGSVTCAIVSPHGMSVAFPDNFDVCRSKALYSSVYVVPYTNISNRQVASRQSILIARTLLGYDDDFIGTTQQSLGNPDSPLVGPDCSSNPSRSESWPTFGRALSR
jgi:hypothetical protein